MPAQNSKLNWEHRYFLAAFPACGLQTDGPKELFRRLSAAQITLWLD